MRSFESGLVDLVREFLLGHELLRRTFARLQSGELRFEELQQLVGDSEASVLFRLKERCHALFRQVEAGGDPAMTRGALFDLAVGSLFHEAMKLRENFYQLAVYAPKVAALRSQAGADADRLFQEFERILAAAGSRLEEARNETEALLDQTREQFRRLLVAHRSNGLVTRYLLENRTLVEQVLGDPLEDLLDQIHGEAIEGYAQAARSYLESGYFEEARHALAEALDREPGRPELRRLAAYSQGMAAYLQGRYTEAVASLERWLEDAPAAEAKPFAQLSAAALLRLGQLVEGSDQAPAAPRAAELARRLQALLAPPPPGASAGC